MYAVYDTFNNKIVSRHRTIEAAVKADRRFQNKVQRIHGQSSYIPTTIKKIEGRELLDLEENDHLWMIECYDWR
jgi:hypothetical protein